MIIVRAVNSVDGFLTGLPRSVPTQDWGQTNQKTVDTVNSPYGKLTLDRYKKETRKASLLFVIA